MFHLHLQGKFIIIASSLLLIAVFFSTNPVLSSDEKIVERRRERCLKILHDGLNHEGDFWINVHAAESLLWNGYFKDVKRNFAARESNAGFVHRIGVWGILAKLSKRNSVEYDKYINLLKAVVINQDSPDRTAALETLAKLGFSEPLPEIVRIAEEGKIENKGFVRWILANSGDPDDEAYFAELLKSDNSKLYGIAAYGLRFFNDICPETFTLLEECVRRLADDAENRVYVVNAVYVHAPPEKKEKEERELLKYAKGDKDEKYVVCEGLSYKGSNLDIEFLEKMLDDPDLDVRVSAANALIRIERRQYRGLKWLDWAAICGYALFMIGIGLFYMYRQKSTDDYLLGGRNVNPIATGISLFATLLSTITYLGAPGETIKYGPVFITLYIATLPIVYFIVSYTIIPLFMRLRITSAYEILEKPLGVKVRLFGSIIFIFTRITWMALLIFITAKAMVLMMNWDIKYINHIVVVSGIITVIYSTLGGFRAVVATSVVQFFFLIMGAALTILLITAKMGGTMEWFPISWAPNWDKFVIFSFDPLVRMTVIGTMIYFTVWWICTAGSDQMAIQRYLSTRDIKAARQAFLSNGIVDAFINALLVLVGLSLLGFFRTNPHLIADGKSIIGDADSLFPHYIANFLPVGITGLVVAGIFSAAMSSFSSGINSTAAVLITDFKNRIKKKKQTEVNHVRSARYFSLIIGITVVIISFFMGKVPGNIMEVTAKTNGLFIAPLFNLFFMALFIPFATPLGTFFGSIYGVYGGAVIAFWDVITGKPGLSFLWILPISLLVSIVFSILFSLLPTKGKKTRIQIIWSVMLTIPLLIIYVFLAG